MQKIQTPPYLLLEGLSERTKVYPEISKLLSSEGVLESRYVSDIQMISNLWIAISTLRRNTVA